MILSLQYLRGIAALMVVYFHCGAQVARFDLAPLPLHAAGEFGVDVFFVISGVVMWVTTFYGSASPATFLLRRLARIAPLYWIITLMVALIAFAAPLVMRSTVFDLPHLVASLLFIPWPNPVGGALTPMLIPGWTLNYEMFFYVLFAVAMFAPKRWRAVVLCAALVAIVAAGAFAPPETRLKFYADPMLLEFGAGVFIGALYTGRRTSAPGAALGVAAGGVALAFVAWLSPAQMAPAARALYAGLPAALVVGGLVLAEKARGAPRLSALLALGDASYSIYLTHALTLAALSVAWRRLDGVAPSAPAYYAVGIGASIFVGWMTFIAIERPINHRLQARRKTRGLAPAK